VNATLERIENSPILFAVINKSIVTNINACELCSVIVDIIHHSSPSKISSFVINRCPAEILDFLSLISEASSVISANLNCGFLSLILSHINSHNRLANDLSVE
jgi:hypothetical protein